MLAVLLHQGLDLLTGRHTDRPVAAQEEPAAGTPTVDLAATLRVPAPLGPAVQAPAPGPPDADAPAAEEAPAAGRDAGRAAAGRGATGRGAAGRDATLGRGPLPPAVPAAGQGVPAVMSGPVPPE